MSQIQSGTRLNCMVLAVLCGKFVEKQQTPARLAPEPKRARPSYPFPELASSGRLEVHTLINPSVEQFKEAQQAVQPNLLYIQGQQLENEKEIGSLVWGDTDLSDPQTFSSLISPPFPTIGIPYVIYWRNSFSSYAASHFRQALMSVVQSCCSHTWDAFQLAHASFRLYCVRNNHVQSVKLGPRLLGDAPKINMIPAENEVVEEEGRSEAFLAIKMYDEDVNMKLLVCGVPCTLDACLLGALEDGLNALLNIESKSHIISLSSAAAPPLQAETLSHGVVTMRCDITTCSSSYVSLLVSGSAQTCFDDQLLESHIKNEIIEKSQLVRALSNGEDNKPSSAEPLSSMCLACGASTFEVWMTMPKWAAQVLKHLAPEISHRSLVALGIACVNGTPVSSFDRQDADRLLFFCSNQCKDQAIQNGPYAHLSRWSASLTKDRMGTLESKQIPFDTNGVGEDNKHLTEGSSLSSLKPSLKSATMRPLPHSPKQQMHLFMGLPQFIIHDASQVKTSLPAPPPAKHSVVPVFPATQRKSSSGPSRVQPSIPLNPLPMKKHGCDRLPIHICSEEDFLKDVMQFLLQRGHTRLVPQGGLAEFPDAVLNTKRLDLYNLYKEGVGNTLKRHYETYLLEYELAHDDVGGECCLICHSGDPGGWVNCGVCGEWAHFGCDKRQGLGTFKVDTCGS
ncbi:AT-rich interactive domain-containing protein 4 [Dichanthelium oligosanthes]|uniref:AT-rich interactive domain-containing protein 4 n=1 Tax=Dichanthelium oligosanthes TaxID=888268 RepID=A0A1E5V381_9POAL|nr:AT-rich interactive domain-containing protein 4 [Dichanthelium oligosanthes]